MLETEVFHSIGQYYVARVQDAVVSHGLRKHLACDTHVGSLALDKYQRPADVSATTTSAR